MQARVTTLVGLLAVALAVWLVARDFHAPKAIGHDPNARHTVDGGDEPRTTVARWVGAFGHLEGGEFGLVEDANGKVALVLDRASAASALRLAGAGVAVRIVGTGPPGTDT